MVDVAADPAALVTFLERMGDNCLILGHRASEWCGHAPVLEEDIAFANTALDLIGQTQLWLGLASEIEGKGRSADDFAYKRDASAFKNVHLVELPNRDFGHSLMRQFLFDAWHRPMLAALAGSNDTRIAEIAAKAAKEAAYHQERTSDLVVRLGDGTEKSHSLMQDALERLWPYTGELFQTDDGDRSLIEAGVAPDQDRIAESWRAGVTAVLQEATLAAPESQFAHKGGRSGHHTEHLGYILAEMQFLQRAYPGAVW